MLYALTSELEKTYHQSGHSVVGGGFVIAFDRKKYGCLSNRYNAALFAACLGLSGRVDDFVSSYGCFVVYGLEHLFPLPKQEHCHYPFCRPVVPEFSLVADLFRRPAVSLRLCRVGLAVDHDPGHDREILSHFKMGGSSSNPVSALADFGRIFEPGDRSA